MGKCTITFEDDDEGIGCRVEFDPPLDLENNVATPAQLCAMEKWSQQLLADPCSNSICFVFRYETSLVFAKYFVSVSVQANRLMRMRQ